MVATRKFSQFVAADLTTSDNQLVGLSAGVNAISSKIVSWTTGGRPVPPVDGILGYNTTLHEYEYYNSNSASWVQLVPGTVQLATYILQTPSALLPNAQALSALSSGILKSTTATGVITISAPLTSIDGLTTAADEMIYTTASNVYAVTSLTAFARTLLADSSAPAARSTLGLGTAATKDASDNGEPNVASTSGAFTINHVLVAADAFGTVKDGGSPAGMGTVTEVDTGTGLVGGPITTTGTISLDVPVTVDHGGTGNTTFTAYSVITAGTTATGAFQNVVGVGSSNQVLVSNGAGFLPSWQSVPGVVPAALTEVDDTNVTLTLGGTPATALLQAVSLTLGWTGTLATARGGTGLSSYVLGDIIYASAANVLSALAGNTTTGIQYLSQTGTGAVSAAPVWATISGGDIAGSALTKTDDTNVTLTLGGTPATALLRATSLTLGWTGQLSVSRGGTGDSSFTAYAVICGGTTSTDPLQSIASVGTSGQVLVSNGAGALPTFQSIAPGGVTSITGTTNQVIASSATGAVTLSLPQDIATSSTPTFNNLILTGAFIETTGGAKMFGLGNTASAVNYVQTSNNATGLAPSLFSTGTDTNIGLNIYTAGTGVMGFISNASTNQFQFVTNAAHTSVMNFPSSSATTTYTWPDASGTISLGGGGTVNSGTINEIAYYASAGTAVSGLATANSAVLVTNSTGVPSLSGTMTNGQVIIGSTGATPTASTLTAGSGITISNGAGSITISSAASGLSWSTISGTTQLAVVDSGYIVGNASQTTITLPTLFNIGEVVIIKGLGAAGWILQAGILTTIQIGQTATSAGGTLTSANQYDTVYVTGIVANTTWSVDYAFSTGLTVA